MLPDSGFKTLSHSHQGKRKGAKAQRDENELSFQIIGAALEVHQTLGGPGLLESVYESALCHELRLRGFNVMSQVKIPVIYKNTTIRTPLCIDILVENSVIVEVKANTQDHAIFHAQLLTYLRLTKLKLGLIINFGHTCLKQGISRVVNSL